MAIRIHVETSEIGQELSLYPSNWEFVKEKAADAMRMLVDSDALSFLYVLETENDLIYVDLGEEHWENIDKAADNGLEAVLHLDNDRKITLSALVPEMEYLVENIKGNTNYGEKMVSKVEESFTSIISKTEEGTI